MSPHQAQSPKDFNAKTVAPKVDAATVILVRDRPGSPDGDPLEIFLVQRHEQLEVAGGRYVFPGGKVDRADCDPLLTERCDGLGHDDAASILLGAGGEESGGFSGLGFWVAAIRELFEEAGILLAYAPDGLMVDSREARYRDYGTLLRDGSLSFADVVAREDLTLAARQLRYFAHWITPMWVPRRFSARFFVAVLPPGQEPRHDQVEAVAGEWLTPREALQRIGEGTMLSMFATQRNLRTLSASRSVADLLEATARRVIEPTMPRRVDVDGETRFVIPGEPGYEEGE